MRRLALLSGAWYGDRKMELELPGEWDVRMMRSEDRPVVSDEAIGVALAHPIGTPPLRSLAEGRRDAVIVVDDLSRPTPASRLLPYIVEELQKGGILQESILIVIGVGTHRSPTRIDLVKKLGEGILRRIEVLPHDIDRRLTFVGESSSGVPVWVNQFVMDSDLKIGVGGIYPRGEGKFGGGAKIILPGVCGAQTIPPLHGDRSAMEEVAAKVGLDFIVNVVVNGCREIIGLFAGNFIEAHREGVRCAREVYAVPSPGEADVIIANAYPFDVTLQESGKGMWPLRMGKEGSTKVFVTAAWEGIGHHHLRWRGRTRAGSRERMEGAEFMLYSPVVGPREAYAVYPDCMFFDRWERLMEEVLERHRGKEVQAVIYPCASIQIPFE
jgi:nickel-dependent lactate racemase